MFEEHNEVSRPPTLITIKEAAPGSGSPGEKCRPREADHPQARDPPRQQTTPGKTREITASLLWSHAPPGGHPR
jgi:hypothetical protein